jgi:hypothetical protein
MCGMTRTTNPAAATRWFASRASSALFTPSMRGSTWNMGYHSPPHAWADDGVNTASAPQAATTAIPDSERIDFMRGASFE